MTGKDNKNSDMDIGIKGFPEGKFFNIDTKIAPVDFDANDDFYSMLNKTGGVAQTGEKLKIAHEISQIGKQISDTKSLLDLCKIKEPDFVKITATAQILHSFYNGAESVIMLFFKYIDEKLPNDIKWHKTLFEMAFGVNAKNIQIINNSIKDVLEDYLSYRHALVQN